MTYSTPAAQKRGEARLSGRTPRTSFVPPYQSTVTPVATPPRPRKSRLSEIHYATSDSVPTSPSISAPPPFDWDAARGNRPAPYGGLTAKPASSRGVESTPKSSTSTPRKRVFRKKTVLERARALPSQIAFEISMFPHNLPLPEPKTSGQLIGGALHVIHMCIKWAGRSAAIANEDPEDRLWRSEVKFDFPDENPPEPWFHWTTPIAVLLLAVSILNMLYLFTRIRTYQLRHRNELVKSPHASIVTNEPKSSSTTEQALWVRVVFLIAGVLATAWRLVFGTSPRPEDLIPVDLQPGANKIQQLEVWNPGEIETQLLVVYSPAHFLAWRIFSSDNWLSSFLIMGVISLQLHTLIVAYEALLKDRAILSAEVMHEYDAKFVNPRMHPLKKDVGTSTSEAEMVDDWRSYGYRRQSNMSY